MLATEALDAMAEAMTAVNAGRWQVQDVLKWRGLIEGEAAAAAFAGVEALPEVEGGAEATRHAGWQMLARQVTGVLRTREHHAEREARRLGKLAGQARERREALLAGETAPQVLARAARLEQIAVRAENGAGRCWTWAAAAGEAAACGARLTRKADQVHLPVGRAIARTPRGWIPQDKTWITAGS